MTIVVRGNPNRLRSAISFTFSACLHGLAVWGLALAPGASTPERPRTLYEREIRPNEHKIVWYNLRQRLPDIAPAQTRKDTRRPRARAKFDQSLVAGARDDARPPQMIWIPEPKTEAPKPLPLPNVVAVAPPPKLVRPFTAPESPRPERAAPQLPDAPRVAAAVEAESLPFAAPTPRLQPRAFTPPPEAPRPQAAPAALPAAPEIAVSAPAEASLVIAGLDPAKTMEVPAPPGSRQAGFSAAPQPRPRGGDDGGRQGALLVVPGLLARGGAKEDQPTLAAEAAPTSRRNLLVAARSAPGPLPPVSTEPRATRVASAPDPRLEGRVIYTVAIQMPNVTSYTGSWIVWFAEREPGPGAALESPPPDMRPPLPLRKVDPKYIAAAASERVEGKVRLAAVIRRNGRVEAVTLLRHLDDRLDRSAEEALAKWEFEPALRNGSAVDVDAVFEIPFRLAPKPAK